MALELPDSLDKLPVPRRPNLFLPPASSLQPPASSLQPLFEPVPSRRVVDGAGGAAELEETEYLLLGEAGFAVRLDVAEDHVE